jgi:galactose mutarotase-like enzyme
VDPGRLVIELEARTDRETLVNLAAHAYFNLDGGGSALDHRLRIAAVAYTPVDADNIPTGEIRAVADSRFDFRRLRPVCREGYDHNFVLARQAREAPAFAARLACNSMTAAICRCAKGCTAVCKACAMAGCALSRSAFPMPSIIRALPMPF